MARRDFLPLTDAALLAFTENFARILDASYGDYDLTPQAAADYAAKQADYAAKLRAAVDPATLGRRTVFLKNEAKTTLVAATRRIARQIGGLIEVSNEQRQALGLTVRSTASRSIPVPTAVPLVKIRKVEGRIVTVELLQSASRRGKPAGVAQAMLFTYCGTIAPQGLEDWQYALTATRTVVDLPFAPSATGDTAYVTAFWCNAKGQAGPAARPASVNLAAGNALPREAGEKPKLKIAA